MALPFLLLTYFPKLLSKMPKPGAWMDSLKRILSIPMFLTAAWLIWVLNSVAHSNLVIGAILTVIIAFTVYISFLNNKKFAQFAPVLLVFLIGIAMINAVSYTHLDVYKRQVKNLYIFCAYLCRTKIISAPDYNVFKPPVWLLWQYCHSMPQFLYTILCFANKAMETKEIFR